MRLLGKTAVVTGAGTGIGQAIALAFAREGASVVVDYVGNASVAEETLNKIEAIGGKSLGVAADVSNPDQVSRLIQQTLAAFGKLDIFVNNAGIEKKFAFVDYPLEEWQKIVAVNLTGAFLCSQGAARQMIAQGGGGRSHQHFVHPRRSRVSSQCTLLRDEGRNSHVDAYHRSRVSPASNHGE
jgi:glucose 1-dehydrogenase